MVASSRHSVIDGNQYWQSRRVSGLSADLTTDGDGFFASENRVLDWLPVVGSDRPDQNLSYGLFKITISDNRCHSNLQPY